MAAMDDHRQVVAERIRTSFALFPAAEAMFKTHLRRERPEADEAAIESAFGAWLAQEAHDCPPEHRQRSFDIADGGAE